MTEATILLDGSGVEPLVAGGKGSALDRLIGLDVRVPATGVITTAAYRSFEATPNITAFVNALKEQPVPEPRDHEAHRQEVDELFLSAPIADALAAEILALAAQVGGAGLVAVRSSATAEDLESASFAGQYESYLNVSAESVLDSVRLVWASLWYPAPRAYRRFRQIDENDLTMAVVVMEMLAPSHAGVLFTEDPGGAPDAVRLEMVEGLGEGLVSGEKTPDAYVIGRSNIEADFAAISAPLGELATEAMRLESAFEAPQDIEFAIDDGRLYFVQARPITTAVEASRTNDGFDFSCGENTTYTTAGIAEMLPGVLAPLSWGINSWLLENGFRSLFDLLGGGADVLTHERALIGRFRGRAALNLDAMSEAAGSVPGGSPEELQRQYFGEAVPSSNSDTAAEPVGKPAGAAQGLRVLRARRGAVEESEVVIQTVSNLVEDEPSLARMDEQELLAYWNRLLHVAQRVVAAEVTVAAMATAAFRGVEVFLAKYMTVSDAAVAARELTVLDGADRRSLIALALDDIVDRIRSDADLQIAAVEDWELARAAFELTVPGQRLVIDFFNSLRDAGSTGIFAGPTWDEVPALAWLTVYTELTSPRSTAATQTRAAARSKLETALARDSRWRWARFVSGQVVDVRLRFLRREAADAAEFLQRREHTKAAVLILGGVVRRANLEIGRRLAEREVLETALDVELLSVGEVGVLVGGQGPTPETLALRRRRNLEAQQAEPLPLRWVGEPPAARSPDISGERFEGWSASPGRYEGMATVVDSPTKSTLRRGEVLVATSTDASWAPLFMAAGAVVVEQGGPLSHAAIVARELGMPAVANVPGLIRRLQREESQTTVVVDGTEGVVTLHLDDTGGGDPAELSADDGGPSTDADSPAPEIDLTNSTEAMATVGAVVSEGGGSGASVGLMPVRQSGSRWDDTTSTMNVFVAGLIGAGALMSLIIGLTESISSARGRERLRRQAAPTASMISQGTIHGYQHVLSRHTGLRPRHHYFVASVVLAIGALAILTASLDSYLSEASGPVVGLALSVSSVATLLTVAAVLGKAARRWPDVPPVVRRVAPGRPPRQHSTWAAVSPPARKAVIAMLGLVATGGLIAVVGESALLAIDEPIYFDWLEAFEDAERVGPDWLNRLGQPVVIIPMAVLIGLLTLRCRVVSVAWPAAIILGGLANLVIGWLVHRERPPLSAHAGEFNSYPGGHSIQLTLLLGMIPLAVHVFTKSRIAMRVAAALSAAVWIVAWTDTVRTGGHWPTDQLAGLLIAGSLLTVVYSAAGRNDLHQACEAWSVDNAPDWR